DDIGAHQLDGGQIAAEVEVQKGKPADQRENSQAEQIPVEVSGVVTALHGGKEHGGAGDFSDGMQENRQQGAVGDKGEGDMVDHHGRHRHGLQMIEGEPAPGPLQAFSGRGRAGGQPLWCSSGKAAAFLQTVVGHAAPSMARRAVTRAGSPAGERMSGVVPVSSLLEPSPFRPNIMVNCTRMPLLGS
ncbi:DUF3298 domain-containing protein, partial [Dysosmobacter welbionis]